MNENQSTTPLMQQYFAIKAEHPDTILLFQVGDFYELFFEDAKAVAAFLGIALTSRGTNKGEPIPLCGVPLQSLDHYLGKLIKGGFKVAICDQLELPVPGKVVKRGVTQVLTPGTLTDSKLLDAKSASYLLSFFPTKDSWGLLFGELLTGQIFATTVPADSEKLLESELVRFFPDEVLVPNSSLGRSIAGMFKRQGYYTTFMHDEVQSESASIDAWMRDQFKDSVAAAVHKQESLRLALYYFYAYVKKNQEVALNQFKNLHLYSPDDFLLLDPATQRNLELVKNAHSGTHANTLFSVLDRAVTPMGSRMIKKWLLRPLVKKEGIVQRHDAVQAFISDHMAAQVCEDRLVAVGDVERIIGRIALQRAQVHDYLALKRALHVLPEIKNIVKQKSTLPLFAVIDKHMENFDHLLVLLESALNDDASKDWIIKANFDTQLDDLRDLVNNGNARILALEAEEIAKTGINSLKIRYNNVFGYYIEVTNANMHLVPDRYIRKQTLAGRERFMTPELQELHAHIMQAKSEIDAAEKRVYERVKLEVFSYLSSLRKLAHALSHLDAILGLSIVAYHNGYKRPQFHDGHDILIKEGKHPVVETTLAGSFIANDTQLTTSQSLWIITGPNMGGKSTYLRQVALICIMAQCGSFVPAQAAQLPLLDRVFTRIGAGDNVAQGKSTFLVEMEETATICTSATQRSLVILDEVGRGTSTFDGLAIAQAVVEHIQSIGARCLFATHYHELTHLTEKFPNIVSYYAANKKTKNGIVFLYKMVQGVADGSFGIEVAKLAQLPPSVIERARELLSELTNQPFERLRANGEGDYSYIKNSFAPVRPEALEGQINIKSDFSFVRPAVSSEALAKDEGIEGSSNGVKELIHENTNLKSQIQTLQKSLEIAQNQLAQLSSIDPNDLTPRAAFDLIWALKSNNISNRNDMV